MTVAAGQVWTEQAVRVHAARPHRAARWATGNAVDAEDLVREAFAKTFAPRRDSSLAQT